MTLAWIIAIGILLLVLSYLLYDYSDSALRPQMRTAVADGPAARPEVAATEESSASGPPRMNEFERTVYCVYPAQIYLGEAFGLDVVIGKDGRTALPAGMPNKTVTGGGKLTFAAAESQPLMDVQLLYDEKDFATRQARQRQRLQGTEDTTFAFAVTPLRAATAPLLVSIGLVPQEAAVEMVEKRVVSEKKAGGSVTETTATTTYVPAAPAVEPLTTVRLLVRVTSMLGLTEAQLKFWRKALVPAVAILLLSIALISGRITDLTEVVVLLIAVLANVAGVEVIPEIKDKLGKI